MRAQVVHYYLENDFIKLMDQLHWHRITKDDAGHLFRVFAEGKDELPGDIVAHILAGNTNLNDEAICKAMNEFEDRGWRE